MRPTASLGLRAARALRIQGSTRRAMPQDMPPVGGYDAVQYKRNLPARGFRPVYYIIGMGAIMTYGWVLYARGVRELNELGREKMWARIHLIPLLTAEEDRDQVRRFYAEQDRERDLLGQATPVYSSDRFVRPRYAQTPPLEEEGLLGKAARKAKDKAVELKDEVKDKVSGST